MKAKPATSEASNERKSSELDMFGELTRRWFTKALGSPTPVQSAAWPAIAAGGHVLVSAPTGTGKTLSAFLVFIDRLKELSRNGKLEKKLYVIYISPLKALAGDIRENLHKPLSGILQEEIAEGLTGPENVFGLNIAIRTGDTTASERRKMIKSPPHILITTPESLYLLLSSASGRGILGTAKAIIIDEIHSMIDSKRGAHLTLSLARLDRLCGFHLQRIGLSATIEPLELAADYLACGEPVTIAAPKMIKAYDISVVAPADKMAGLPEGTIWPEIARSIYDECGEDRSVIAFVEGRMWSEKLAYYVNQIAGDGFARTHHGCVSKEQRHQAENDLRSGRLRLLCATSSMELGIDVGDIDRVVQISVPSTISSVMQRLGRAGHNPGRVSVMRIYPRMTSEALTCGLTARVASNGGIENSRPPRLCFDVLAQHLVSMATEDGYEVSEAMDIIHRAYPFREVTRKDAEDILGMLAGDYEHSRDLPVRPRLLYDRVNGRVQGDRYSSMLAVSTGGTIPDMGMFSCKTENGVKLGELDEEYVFEARVGDKLLLGSFAWKIRRIDRESVIVSQTDANGAQPPFWRHAWLSRRYQTALEFGRIIERINTVSHDYDSIFEILTELGLDEVLAHSTTRFIERQVKVTGFLPDHQTIITEHFSDEAGDNQIMIHSAFGRQVNAPLAILLQGAAERSSYMDISCFESDDGILLMSTAGVFPEGLLRRIDPDTAEAELKAILPATPLFGMTFRYNAARALMMGVRQAKRQPLWVQRLRGAEMLDMVVKHENHPLIRETKRECLEDYWDLPALIEVLTGIRSGRIQLKELYVSEPSPMSLQMRRKAEATLLYEYSPTTTGVNRAADEALREVIQMKPAAEALAKVSERKRLPEDANSLHSLLMIEGDMLPSDLVSLSDNPATVQEWLETLADACRVLYIEPGLWIAAEHQIEYAEALENEEPAAMARVSRRMLRYRGAMDCETLAARYAWTLDEAEAVLKRLVASAEAKFDDGLYYHADLYERARNETIQSRRRQIRTKPPQNYAALLAARLRVHAPQEEQLKTALFTLINREFPIPSWEGLLLPARVSSYRPGHLDALLAGGEFFWSIINDSGKESLVFHSYDDIDWNADMMPVLESLDGDAKLVYKVLLTRGASFASGLSGAITGSARSAYDVLCELMEQGLVRADSFAPVRQYLDRAKTEKSTARQRVNARVNTLTSGRWDISRPVKEPSLQEAINSALDKYVILCRETAHALNIPWIAALELLRVMEYTGGIRRGYFVEGLSGAQYVKTHDFEYAVSYLEAPENELIWLAATDPCQAWGSILKHLPGREFQLLAGTVVALYKGLPVAVVERSGAVLRIFNDADISAKDMLSRLAWDYTAKRIFPSEKRLTLRDYPGEASSALSQAGFTRVMDDYVLHREVY